MNEGLSRLGKRNYASTVLSREPDASSQTCAHGEDGSFSALTKGALAFENDWEGLSKCNVHIIH